MKLWSSITNLPPNFASSAFGFPHCYKAASETVESHAFGPFFSAQRHYGLMPACVEEKEPKGSWSVSEWMRSEMISMPFGMRLPQLQLSTAIASRYLSGIISRYGYVFSNKKAIDKSFWARRRSGGWMGCFREAKAVR